MTYYLNTQNQKGMFQRGKSKTIEQQNLARKFGKDFFDGDPKKWIWRVLLQ